VAAQTLGTLKAHESVPALRAAAEDGTDIYIRAEALRGLIVIEGAEALRPWLEALSRDSPFNVRDIACEALGALASDGPLGGVDRRAVDLLRNGRRPAGVPAARVVSGLAEPGFAGALLAASAVTTARRDGWRAACAPCLVVASGAVARRVLSRVIGRPRPPAAGWLTEPEGFSLPSKHATLAALTAGALAGRIGGNGLPSHAAPLLAAAGGASRVYLGVHWPTDVLAGWLFAEGWLRLPGLPYPAGTRAGRPAGPENLRHARRC
jgi:membrane-associated phospholipid phosphatase